MNKTLSITLLSIIIALIVTTIAITFIPYSYKPDISDPTSITVYNDGKHIDFDASGDEDEAEIYSELLSLFNDSMKESVIGALFNGQIGNRGDITVNSIRSLSTSSGMWLTFDYGTNLQILQGNGSDYYNDSDVRVSYSEIYVELDADATDEMTSLSIYIIDDTTSSYIRMKYSYEVRANIYDLVEYVSEIDVL